MDPTPSDSTQKQYSNLPMKILIVVLLVVLVGQIGYIFFNSNIKLNNIFSKIFYSTVDNKNKVVPFKHEFQGKIIEINPIISPFLGSDSIKFSFILQMEDNTVKKTLTFFYNENQLSSLLVKNSKGNIISYNNLKIGQNIFISNKLMSISIFEH